jgi:hypothetical protein
MDINALTKKYTDEDKHWSVAVLMKWLTERKQIPAEIASHSLAEVLLEVESGKDIPTHHEFDNYVLQKSREHLTSINQMTVDYLATKIDKFKEVVEVVKPIEGGYWKKLWMALAGKL